MIATGFGRDGRFGRKFSPPWRLSIRLLGSARHDTQTKTAVSAAATWLILGERAGDNAQVLALGRVLSWPTDQA